MSELRVLILPGRGGSGADHWQTHWEAAHPDFIRVQQAEWENPVRATWVAALQAVVAQDSRPTLLVAHSLSVSLVAHWAAAHPHSPVRGALLVAPSDVEAPAYPVGTTGFAPIPQQGLPFPAIVVASTDDPRVTLPRAQQFAQAWGARLETVGAQGHLGSASRLENWPQGYRFLQELIDGVHARAA